MESIFARIASLRVITACLLCCLACAAVDAQKSKESGAKKPESKKADSTSKANDGSQEKSSDEDKTKAGQEKNDAAEVLMRPGEPPEPPDPKELEARADADGRIRFRFRNQPWPDFLEWLSELSGYSLDWQQMPGGYLNLVTHRSYSIREARDLVNRLLLDRGYTTVLQGQVLSVVKLDKLDPSVLPRIEDESQLHDLPPHEFGKITFELPDKLKAEELVEDVKPLLSPHHKVQALVASNRLLVIDVVANLRDVSRLVNSEHAASRKHQVPREFHIRYARADYVADQVMILLGLDPSSRRSPSELQVEQQRLQLFQQMQQKGKDVTKYLRKDDSPKVFITVNKRVNSVLVNAPPDLLVDIERAIAQLDVPSGAAGGSLVSSGNDKLEMRQYVLVTLKPESVVTALKEIGDLDPRTMLQMDSDAKVVLASATTADHEKIAAIISRLDGSGREVEVIWLRRLPADQVAITIRNLLVGREKKEESTGRFSYYSRWYGNRNDDEEEKSEFRVEPDIENNRLLLYVNKLEMEAVNKLLAKLGELPGEQGNPNTVRIHDPRGNQATADLIRRLREVWPSIAPNELRIEGELPPASKPTEAPSEAKEPESGKATQAGGTPRMTLGRRTTQRMYFVGFPPTNESGRDSHADAAQPSTPPPAPPITVRIAEDGRLILSSLDTVALDALEELIVRVAPPIKNHRVFFLKYALASLVKLNLEEYFEDEDAVDSEENWRRAWIGLEFKNDTSKGNGLASRRPIRFIYDIDTNSILVRDASPAQMAIIEELIDIYDRAPSEESISARRLKVFRLRYSKADVVAATIKDVFRDLLSSRDKEFAGKQDDKAKRSSTSSVFRIFGDTDKKATKVKASFEGALSVGVDTLSNAVIVSAQEEWLPSIEAIINYMDENAKPETTVVVQSVSVPMDPESMKALSDLLRPWPGNKKPIDKSKPKGKDKGDRDSGKKEGDEER